MTDEINLLLGGGVKKQNYRFYSEENPEKRGSI
jgi:hypothetical protein